MKTYPSYRVFFGEFLVVSMGAPSLSDANPHQFRGQGASQWPRPFSHPLETSVRGVFLPIATWPSPDFGRGMGNHECYPDAFLETTQALRLLQTKASSVSSFLFLSQKVLLDRTLLGDYCADTHKWIQMVCLLLS